MKGRSRKSGCTIDGVNGDKDIAVPFDNYDMFCIISTRCSGYVITLVDVRIAVDHFKSGKCDDFEGLCYEHSINGAKYYKYVFLLYYEVCNGVKQGGILSLILFAVYVDSLFSRLEQSGVGCTYADILLVL